VLSSLPVVAGRHGRHHRCATERPGEKMKWRLGLGAAGRRRRRVLMPRESLLTVDHDERRRRLGLKSAHAG
jgi:hypothetical protein